MNTSKNNIKKFDVELIKQENYKEQEIVNEFKKEYDNQREIQQKLNLSYKEPIFPLNLHILSLAKCPMCKNKLKLRRNSYKYSVLFIYNCICGYKFAGFDTMWNGA
jgi:hypothetical protein